MLRRSALHPYSCIASAVVLALAVTPSPLSGQAAAAVCDTGRWAEFVRADLAELMVGSDSESSASRAMYALPQVPEEEVRIVTDDALCAQASRAYYRHVLGRPERRGVAVVQVGDAYAVIGGRRAGEWTILTIFNRDWQALANLGR